MVSDPSQKFGKLAVALVVAGALAACGGGSGSVPSVALVASQSHQVTPKDANGINCNEQFYVQGNVVSAAHATPPFGAATAYVFSFKQNFANLNSSHTYELQYWAAQYYSNGVMGATTPLQHYPVAWNSAGQQIYWTAAFGTDPCSTAGVYFQDIVWDTTANAPANGSSPASPHADGVAHSVTGASPSATCAPYLSRPGSGSIRHVASCLLSGDPTDAWAYPGSSNPTPPPCKKQPCPLAIVRKLP